MRKLKMNNFDETKELIALHKISYNQQKLCAEWWFISQLLCTITWRLKMERIFDHLR